MSKILITSFITDHGQVAVSAMILVLGNTVYGGGMLSKLHEHPHFTAVASFTLSIFSCL